MVSANCAPCRRATPTTASLRMVTTRSRPNSALSASTRGPNSRASTSRREHADAGVERVGKRVDGHFIAHDGMLSLPTTPGATGTRMCLFGHRAENLLAGRTVDSDVLLCQE